jgi:hypothetical protein
MRFAPILAAVIASISLPAGAEMVTERFQATVSPAAEVVLGPAWQPAWLLGFSTRHQVVGAVYLGGAGYGGFSSLGSMGYGGATLAVNGKLGDWGTYDASVLLGGAGGSAFGTSGGGFAVEPSVSIGFNVFAHPSLRIGYLSVPASPASGGLAIGLHLNLIDVSVDYKHPAEKGESQGTR